MKVRTAEKRRIEDLPEFAQSVAKIESALGNRGRVLIRNSGTEPLVRIMVEGDDEKKIREYAHDLADQLRRTLGG